MYRSFKCEKDCYITNRVIKGVQQTGSNTGQAGTIDIFKLYGITSTGTSSNTEISRGLLKFDIDELQNDYNLGKIDPSSPTFKAYVSMKDVYGGQTTPYNFTLQLIPLSKSFDEGSGKDIVYYQDKDVCNYITSSYMNGTYQFWNTPGASKSGSAGTNCDIITTVQIATSTINLVSTQSFFEGSENLMIDVTNAVSATLAGNISNNGFRLSFVDSEEQDQKTRFVKRFGTKNSIDPYKRPQLIIKFDDSIINDQNNSVFDTTCSLFIYNNIQGEYTNFLSASNQLTASNCIKMRLISTHLSGSTTVEDEYEFSGSSYRIGNQDQTGIYTSNIFLDSTNPVFSSEIQSSGSVTFKQIWSSLDNTIGFYTGSIEVKKVSGNVGPNFPKKYYVSLPNVSKEYSEDTTTRIKVFIFDYSDATVKTAKTPALTPSVVIKNAHWSVRDVITGERVIDFDEVYNSTKISSDGETMYFDMWMNTLVKGRLYEFDIKITEGGKSTVYRSASSQFKIV